MCVYNSSKQIRDDTILYLKNLAPLEEVGSKGRDFFQNCCKCPDKQKSCVYCRVIEKALFEHPQLVFT